MHGVTVGGRKLAEEQANLGLIRALMHDMGYIQRLDNDVGKGAKYPPIHTDRSIAFIDKYIDDRGLSPRASAGRCPYPTVWVVTEMKR